jgi:DNA-binding CsgD family transcriptional regulator
MKGPEQLRGSSVGMLLLDSSLKPIYANSEALHVLAYPTDPRMIRVPLDYLDKRVRPWFRDDFTSRSRVLLSEFQSGNRRYLCRAFALDSVCQNSLHPSIALLIERGDRISQEVSRISEQHHLTIRERETLTWLMRGLTSKEIANRMEVSPNTVKAFLRLIMLKMSVTTRSAILGKILETEP